MNFGQAIEAMKLGEAVARAGWNGRDMWVARSPGKPHLDHAKFWSSAARLWASKQFTCGAEALPCYLMKTADNKIQMGWLASQSDIDAEDWSVVSV